jgi:hypothetical protein
VIVAALVPVARRAQAFLPLARECIAAQVLPPGVQVVTVEDINDGPVGAARERICECAFEQLGAEFGVFVDVDDPSPRWRFAVQLAALVARPAMMICGTSRYYCVDLRTGQAVERQDPRNVKDSSLLIRRAAWRDRHFDATASMGECNSFLTYYRRRGQMFDLNRHLTVYTRWPGATVAPDALLGGQSNHATRAVLELLGQPLLDRYRAAAGL